MSAMSEGMKACPFCQRDESELEGNMWDRDRGAAAVAAIPPEEIVRASDMLREYNGKTNSWGARAALISAVGMLRGRYQNVRCDSDGVSGCVRCMTMFLVRSMECLLAASARTAAPSSSPDAEALHIVFDGPPGHESGRFVECETPDGKSVKAGEWRERSDGLWELRIAARTPAPSSSPDVVDHLRRLLAGAAGENELQVGRHMLIQGIEEAANALEQMQRRVEAMRETLKKLSFAAQTGGGVAGADHELMNAIEVARAALGDG